MGRVGGRLSVSVFQHEGSGLNEPQSAKSLLCDWVETQFDLPWLFGNMSLVKD